MLNPPGLSGEPRTARQPDEGSGRTKQKKPRSVHYKQLRGFPPRFLADSNRRTWFCRPLTKPLIQGTESIKNKSNFQFLILNFQLPRGSWRIRTAVHGFADR
jgi:hypothetical protein